MLLGLTVRIGGKYEEARLNTRVYEFRPLSEELKALRLDALRQSTGIWVCVLKGCEPLSQRRGLAYIECARTPAILHYRGSMYIKIGRYW